VATFADSSSRWARRSAVVCCAWRSVIGAGSYRRTARAATDRRTAEEWFSLLRLPAGTPIDHHGWDDVERRSMIGHRWFTTSELATTTETVYPEGLPALVTALLADGTPPTPLEISSG
jgi:hypothetical protein